MIDNRDLLRTVSADLELISHDLATVYGTLSEIATVWRRAREDWPELPLPGAGSAAIAGSGPGRRLAWPARADRPPQSFSRSRLYAASTR